METLPLWVPVLFFVIAGAYAMVGLGGGSSYVAALVTIGIPYAAVPQVALACNILVTSGCIWQFRRAGYVSPDTCLPFLVASVPAAYLGGRLAAPPGLFAGVLGVALFAAGVWMLVSLPEREVRPAAARTLWTLGVPLGAVVGFVSGFVGIGGGILLGAVLVLARWMDAKTAAGTLAVFTFANSVAGFAGHVQREFVLGPGVLPLLAAVVLGGQLGSRVAARRLPAFRLRQVLAVLLLFVSVRTLWGIIQP